MQQLRKIVDVVCWVVFLATVAFMIYWSATGRDRSGRISPARSYDYYSEGLRVKKQLFGLYGYVNEKGERVIDYRFIEAQQFSEGLAAVLEKDKRGFGYIDKQGVYVIEPQYYEAGPFVNGLAPVSLGPITAGFINKNNDFVIEPKYWSTNLFWGEVAQVSTQSKRFYVNAAGEEISEGHFDRYGYFHPVAEPPESFSEGLKVDKNKDGLFGFVDQEGEVVIQHRFSWARPFSEGLACVRDKQTKKVGFIDKTGSYVIRPKFNWAGSFSEGFAPASIKEEAGYIDKKGAFVIKRAYRVAYDFRDGVARVMKQRGKFIYINKQGEEIDPRAEK